MPSAAHALPYWRSRRCSLCAPQIAATLRRHAPRPEPAACRIPARSAVRRRRPERRRRAVRRPVRAARAAERLAGGARADACAGARARPDRRHRDSGRPADGHAHAARHRPSGGPARRYRRASPHGRHHAPPAHVLTAAPVAINARAAMRRELGGVERWARELSELLPLQRPDRYRVIRPPAALAHRAGHVWEQLVLPAAARGTEALLSPANLAPLAGRRNVVVIHDSAPFQGPSWYRRAYGVWHRALVPRIA